MLTQWLGSLGGKLSAGWVEVALTPGAVLWAGGLGVYYLHPFSTRLEVLQAQLNAAPASAQVLAAIGVLVLLGTTELILRALTLPVTRLLEGYWPRPFDRLSRFIAGRPIERLYRWNAKRRGVKREDESDRLDWLVDHYNPTSLDSLTPEEKREFVALDERFHDVPVDSNERKPTRFGNIIRAVETRIAAGHGLDPVACWPQMWLVLPADTRTEITAARSNLDTWVRIWLAGLLFALWSIPTWWWLPAVVGIGVSFATFFVALPDAARTYSGLQEAAFDVHWRKLYDALDWPLPLGPADEAEYGRAVTTYLWRGMVDAKWKYRSDTTAVKADAAAGSGAAGSVSPAA
jgi:hypothetical protein